MRIWVALLCMGMLTVTAGCAVMRHLDGSTDAAIDAHVAYEGETAPAKPAPVAAPMQPVQPAVSPAIVEEQEKLARELDLLKREQAMLREDLKKKSEAAPAAPEPAMAAPAFDKAKLKIKVLSGDGKIASARKLSDQIVSMGYKVERIDLAPRSNFEYTTVFYAEGFKEQALGLGQSLGKSVIVKPLTWKSIFNLIAVKGLKP